MSSAPIYNPMVPCIEPIPGGMYLGRMVRIQGNTPPGSQRFAFNLQCGPNTDPRDDIALHLNFRFVEMCVVRNNLTNMNWGPEEIGGGMPLVPGQPFEALLLCEPNSIKVALNGVHFCEFAHRTQPQRITHITVDGDVNIQFIGFEGSQPQGYMPQQQPGYAAPVYGAPPPAYGQAAPPHPGYEQPLYSSGVQQQRSGMGTGAAVGLGVGALAAGGLAGYALGGGFSSNDSPREEVHVASPDEGGDFGGDGDDWVE